MIPNFFYSDDNIFYNCQNKDGNGEEITSSDRDLYILTLRQPSNCVGYDGYGNGVDNVYFDGDGVGLPVDIAMNFDTSMVIEDAFMQEPYFYVLKTQ